MKVLIWFGCIFVATILNTLLGLLTGIKAGYLVFYLAVYFVASKLCQKWDEHKEEKAERKKQASGGRIGIGYPVEAGNNTSVTSGWQCSCGRVHPAYETSCVCGKSKFDRKLEQPQSNATADGTNKICSCRKCGEKLIDGSRFCGKCGTQVAEAMASPE